MLPSRPKECGLWTGRTGVQDIIGVITARSHSSVSSNTVFHTNVKQHLPNSSSPHYYAYGEQGQQLEGLAVTLPGVQALCER